MSEEQKAPQQAEERVEDLEVTSKEADDVKGGGRKAGKEQQEYYKVTLEDVQISSY